MLIMFAYTFLPAGVTAFIVLEKEKDVKKKAKNKKKKKSHKSSAGEAACGEGTCA